LLTLLIKLVVLLITYIYIIFDRWISGWWCWYVQF